MKKYLAIMIFLIIVSCNKKDWFCTCTSDIDDTIVEVSNYNLTESEAISACTNKDNEPDISCALSKK